MTSSSEGSVCVVGALLLAASFAVPRYGAAQQEPQNERCVACHLEQDDETLRRPATEFDSDVHATAGFGCLDCHGGDPVEDGAAPDAAGGFLSKPNRQEISRLCGRCHSDAGFMRDYNPALRVDQVMEYATSVHGNRLARFNDPNVAVCVSCHPAHEIKPPSEPQSSVHPLNVAETCGTCHSDTDVMESYEIPTDQKEDYEHSVHWTWMSEEGDLSAPTCNDCHGNHGAAPPGIASVQNVCGQCHNVMETFFTGGIHAEYFLEEGLPGCETCHGNHDIETSSDDMLVRLNETVCRRCHLEGEIGSNEFLLMGELIDSLQANVSASRAILLEAENLGMEVSQAQFELEDVTNALVKARTAIHSFAVDTVRQEVEAGLAITALASERGEDALGEHLFRRQGLAVSVALILLLIAGLALKIKQLERPPAFDSRQGKQH